MEDQENQIPKEFQIPEIKPKEPEKEKITKGQIITGIIIVALIVIGGYILNQNTSGNCEVIRNDSLAEGFDMGVEYWNAAVMYKISNNVTIPYFNNGTYYEQEIVQMCEAMYGR